MEKKVEEMGLQEATELLDDLMGSGDAPTEEGFEKRRALYEHILELCELKTGGEG